MYSVELIIDDNSDEYTVSIQYLSLVVSEVKCSKENYKAIIDASLSLTKVYNEKGIKPFGFSNG